MLFTPTVPYLSPDWGVSIPYNSDVPLSYGNAGFNMWNDQRGISGVYPEYPVDTGLMGGSTGNVADFQYLFPAVPPTQIHPPFIVLVCPWEFLERIIGNRQ